MIINANALAIPLADNSVQCAVTSPPYYGLRDYGIPGQLGLEPTPDEYVDNMVAVFREVRRVLRPDGVCWLNLGDSYAGGAKKGDTEGAKQKTNKGATWGGNDELAMHKAHIEGLKPKDLIGIPWRVAFALQADGWWLRSEIIWAKPNPMPESVTDRPTKSHEQIFLLTKSARYYYDADAVREEYAPASLPRALRGVADDNKWSNGEPGSTAHTMSKGRPNQRKAFEKEHGGGGSGFNGHSGYVDANGRLLVNPNGRNLRSVWHIATEATPFAHFATFPRKLAETCIKAGTSEKGCCPKCGAAWERVVETTRGSRDDTGRTSSTTEQRMGKTPVPEKGWESEARTIGWQPACSCSAGEPVPCIVLDPFCGSGTVGLVAQYLGRQFVGLDLSLTYLEEIAQPRLANGAGALFMAVQG